MKGSYSSGPSRRSRFRPHHPSQPRIPDPEAVPEGSYPEEEPLEPEEAAGGEEETLAAPEEGLAGGDAPEVAFEPEAEPEPGLDEAEEPFEQEEVTAAGGAAPVYDPQDRLSPMARPRRQVGPEHYVYASPPKNYWLRAARWTALIGGGAVAGYLIALATRPPARKPAPAFETIRTVEKPPPLTPEERTQLDGAFKDGREGRYKESRQLFESLTQKHPLWAKVPLEIARMDIYQEDYIAAQKILGVLMQGDSDARADAFFLSGVLNLKAQNFPDAELAFAAATDADPTRSEFFYFWGDCLRQEGKPQEARSRFQSALYRNQYETAEDLLQLKVWLCDITMDQEKADGADAAIDAALAMPYPRAAALLAAAARAMKANHFAEAADFITRGRAAMDQVVFRVVMHDPTFFQESWRAELAPFYAENGAPAPAPPAAANPKAASPAPHKP